MGKSPGKWIKTVLFGKKSSKSNLSRDATIERKASFSAKAPASDSAVNPSLVSDPAPLTAVSGRGNTGYEQNNANLPSAMVTLLPEMQGADGRGTMGLHSVGSDELNRQHQAASKVQAAFRSYLARRAFRALKGIIRLQALVRGHLVRRQAVATLHCMWALVKFQALVRGRMVRLSAIGREAHIKCSLREPTGKRVDTLGVNMYFTAMNISTNAFVRKLLASLPTAMPLSLRYELVEPNSTWNWLERWSSSRFWKPLPRSKKILDAKPKRKQANMQTGEIEAVRPRRSMQKVPAINGDGSLLHSSVNEKPKRNPRKVLSHSAKSGQEQPQYELEKVKRNLRKISSAPVPSDKPEAVIEEPQHNRKKASGSPAHVSEQGVDHSFEKSSDSAIAVLEQPVAAAPPEPLRVNKSVDMLDNNSLVELHSLENNGMVETSPTVNEEPSSKEIQTSKENQRSRRRKSFPAKQEYPECVSQNTSTLPSYMQATESAKAKLRAQESPRFSDDGAENVFTRRHSLPSSNVKLSSSSPLMQKSLQANGKGGSRSNRSFTSSRDEKVLQAGWRR